MITKNGAKVIFDQLGLGWSLIDQTPAKLLYAGSVLGANVDDLLALLRTTGPDLEAIISLVRGFKGHFGLVYQDKHKIVAITDCIASFPIFYRSFNGFYNIATCAKALACECHIDTAQATAVLLSGYTVADNTLFKEISVLGHGQIIHYTNRKNFEITQYYQFSPWREPFQPDYDKLKQKLVKVTLESIKRVIELAPNAQIAVPLSAGVDSRLIASALKHIGAKNVLCYSYGPKGNFEGKIAKLIADKLGFEWVFVELTPGIQKNFWKTKIPSDFSSQSNDFLAAPVYHDLLVTFSLIEKKIIQSDTLIVNGNSGDFITGNHMPIDLIGANEICSESNVHGLMNSMLQKHYAMWQDLQNEENLDLVESLLMSQLEEVGGMDGSKSIVALYEYLEMTNRQIKWVIKRQKIYDFFALNWALPLWDQDFISFWERVPLEYKQQQNLYRDMLYEQNWGGVWNSIPGNEARFVSPKWMRFGVRPFFKALCLPLGKARWHSFEKRFLDYWLDELGLYGPFGYTAKLREKGLARNCLAPHIRAYAADMGFEHKVKKIALE